MEVSLKDRTTDDAERIWNILNNDNFRWFGKPPLTIEGEREFIEKELKDPLKKNYTIMLGDEIVGGIGIKFDAHRNWLAETGYFVEEKHWGKGIATKALTLLIEKAKEEGIKRFELVTDLNNIGSQKAAIKAGFQRESIQKMKIKDPREGGFCDCYLFVILL